MLGFSVLPESIALRRNHMLEGAASIIIWPNPSTPQF
jgi:hypothetical protein